VVAERSDPTGDPATRLAPEVIEGFAGFLDEWEKVARESDTFLWDTEVDPEQIEFLALALFKIAVSLSSEPPPLGRTGRPLAGELFYRAFVVAFLDAMEAENRSLAAYAEELRSSWPDLDD
jgi:hypothetical protein